MYIRHHRPDITHIINTLCRALGDPTTFAMRKLKKLTRYLLGKVDVYPQLTPNHHAEVSNVPVGSYGAGKKKVTRRRCSGGAVLFYGCAVLTWARFQTTRALSRAEAELCRIGS